MKNSETQRQYNVSEENNQLVIILNSEIRLPKDAPVRVTSAQLEELDYRKLYAAYSSRGRKSVADPRVLFKVMAYGYQCGIYSSRKLEEACKYRVDFMWLLENGKAPNHATFSRFRTGRCAEAVEDLFYQYVMLSSPLATMSTDYIDYLDCGIQPPDGSQYWVAPFIQEFLVENESLISENCLQYLRDNTSMEI